MTQHPQVKAYRRQRMLEVRKIVAETVKNGGRVDQLSIAEADVPRYLIALQDMLDDANTRHAKATDHIQKNANALADTEEMYLSAMADSGNQFLAMHEEILRAESHADNMEDEAVRLSEGWNRANMDVNSLTMENENLQRRIEALLSTIAILSEGSV